MAISLVARTARNVSGKVDRDFLIHRFAVGLKWIYVNPEFNEPNCPLTGVLCPCDCIIYGEDPETVRPSCWDFGPTELIQCLQ